MMTKIGELSVSFQTSIAYVHFTVLTLRHNTRLFTNFTACTGKLNTWCHLLPSCCVFFCKLLQMEVGPELCDISIWNIEMFTT